MSSSLSIVQTCRVAWPHLGGMERVVHELSQALLARGHRVRVVSLDRGLRDDVPLPTGEHEGVRYARVARLGPRRWPFGRGLSRVVRGADLVHHHGLDGMAEQLVLGRVWHGAAVGVSTHGGPLHTGRQATLKRLWLARVSRRTLADADGLWFTSPSDAETLGALGLRGSVLTDGVDCGAWQRIERRPEPGRWLVLGRVDVHKGLEAVVDLLVRWPGRAPRVHVVGPEQTPGLVAALRARARAGGVADQLVFHGALPEEEVRLHMARCERMLFPSNYEGFGLTLVQAMSAGVPVYASPIAAHRDRLGETGTLLDFTSAQAVGVLQAPLPGHAALLAARERAARWDWSQVVTEVERAYEAALSRRSRR